LRVFQLERPRWLHHRALRRPAQLLHSEDLARHRPRRSSRQQPRLCRPRGLPFQDRSVLLQRLHAERWRVGRADFDGGL